MPSTFESQMNNCQQSSIEKDDFSQKSELFLYPHPTMTLQIHICYKHYIEKDDMLYSRTEYFRL